MQLLVHLLIPTLVFFFLKLCSAAGIVCTVTQVGGETHYNVPEFNAADCYFQWTNDTNYVLANQEQRTDECVVSKSNRTLVTRHCIKRINYKPNCLSKEIQTVTCTSNCSRKVPPPPEHAVHHWVAPVAVAVVLVLLVVLLVLLGLNRCGVLSCNKSNNGVV